MLEHLGHLVQRTPLGKSKCFYCSMLLLLLARHKSLGNISVSQGTPATMRSSSMRRFIEKTGTSRRSRSGDRTSMTMPSRVKDLKRKTMVLVPTSEDKLNVIFVDEDSQEKNVEQRYLEVHSDDEN